MPPLGSIYTKHLKTLFDACVILFWYSLLINNFQRMFLHSWSTYGVLKGIRRSVSMEFEKHVSFDPFDLDKYDDFAQLFNRPFTQRPKGNDAHFL